MPLYQFEDPNGEGYDEFFLMNDAPAVGSTIVRKGKTLTRVFSSGTVGATDRHTPFASVQVDPELARELGHERFNSDGHAVFLNQKEAYELARRSNGRLAYGAMPTKSETEGREATDVWVRRKRKEQQRKHSLDSRNY